MTVNTVTQELIRGALRVESWGPLLAPVFYNRWSFTSLIFWRTGRFFVLPRASRKARTIPGIEAIVGRLLPSLWSAVSWGDSLSHSNRRRVGHLRHSDVTGFWLTRKLLWSGLGWIRTSGRVSVALYVRVCGLWRISCSRDLQNISSPPFEVRFTSS